MYRSIRRATVAFGAMAGLGTMSSPMLRWSAPRVDQDVEALGAIVGVWQSDTVGGVSALSNCAWTPEHGGVVCEQIITGLAGGARHALNLYTFDATEKRYVYYGLPRPGEAMAPVPLGIEGRVWTYGGRKPEGGGPMNRTINDFSAPGIYTWRQETSQDGKEWTVGRRGQSKRVR
jgi:hypothetical protein